MAESALWARIAVTSALAALAACNSVDHPPPPRVEPPQPGAATDGGIVIDGNPNGGPPTCGGQSLKAIVDAPILEFVIDRSASMLDPIDASGAQKYAAAVDAIGTVLGEIGSRVRYGAIIYPATDLDGSCDAGKPVFPPTQGDAPSAVPAGGKGPLLSTLLNRLAAFVPGGATPTAATLHTLPRILESYGGRSYVVLVTDGAPNCDFALTCDSDACIPDIERQAVSDETVCGIDLSCCDPRRFGTGNCIDADASEAEVRALADAGIDTYVIGMPGSEAYAQLLTRLAVAGNTARPEGTAYFAVSDTDALTDAVFEIGTGLSIGCDLALDMPPDDPNLVNVYFDGTLVPFDADEGWTYAADLSVSVQGDACRALKSGEVRDVTVTYGCETVVR